MGATSTIVASRRTRSVERTPDVAAHREKVGRRGNSGMTSPTVFISYSWDDAGHRRWVRNLATKLRSDGVSVTLDAWSLAPGDQLPHFMETAVRQNDYVLIIATQKYKLKSDNRAGGVGYEGDIITAEVSTKRNHRKFVPILRRGEWSKAAPSWLLGKVYIDMRGRTPASTYLNLLQTLHQRRPPAPPIGQRPDSVTPAHLKDLLAGMLVGHSGRFHIANEWFAPEFNRIGEELRKNNLASAVDHPEYAPSRGAPDLPGTAFTGGLIFVLNASISSESTSVVVEELWTLYVRPSFDRLQRLYKKWKRYGFKIGFELEIHYKPDQLSVITEVVMSSAAEVKAVHKLVTEAQWRALKWVEERGVASSQLVFSIQSGALARFPRTIEKIAQSGAVKRPKVWL